jgi:hypothetical protein
MKEQVPWTALGIAALFGAMTFALYPKRKGAAIEALLVGSLCGASYEVATARFKQS